MNQSQKKILKITNKLHEVYGNDPVGWINNYISFSGLSHHEVTDQQDEICNSLVRSKNVCISAGGGIGKTAIAALICIWFLCTHPYAKIPTTAPSNKQLMDVLWSEIGLWLKRCKLQDLFALRKGRLYIKGFEEWYAVARTVPRDGKNLNDTLAGFHAPHLMILCDEASGIPDPVFTALEGAMTNENSFIFLISNPVSSGGYYFDTISDPDGKGQDYEVLYFDSRASPIVDDSYEQRIINRYGENHPMYKAKVLGQPIADMENAVISPEMYDYIVNNNKDTHDGSVTMAIDLATGEGEDKTIFCHKIGNSIVRWDEVSLSDPHAICEMAISLYKKLWAGRKFTCIIDAGGIGWGPYNELSKAAFNVVGYLGQEKSEEPYMFRDKRTEGYFYLSQIFEELHFPSTPPDRLKKELVNIKFNYADQPMRMEDKTKLRSRLGYSPDYSDALMMACSVEKFSQAFVAKQVPKGTMKKLEIPKRTDKFGSYSKFIV